MIPIWPAEGVFAQKATVSQELLLALVAAVVNVELGEDGPSVSVLSVSH